ncbi:hypothetical protein SAMN02745857_03005 [Andreprevotia lacus DSM 23236]|jgi:hypothetical protein|uniref:Putative DNA-binding domain-containing protein n=1 Tax=Andreprevotia lacus DSM 23236 TaxID=1121001 RepID=A0A1W1XVI2_9NEIS|nr:putative DNA-binding domain-containing protein [Andreprevotia lacus]SMC27872.1 hypothetical protein SAMN02745857_03005 [Andreprevotia lacus DSM 23236]
MPSPCSEAAPAALTELQHFMQQVLMSSDNRGREAQIARHIAPGPRLPAAEHLAIYQRAYLARLLQCMQGQFKALNHALGPALFRDFAADYLREQPSSSPTLAHLGAGFADYLRRNRPDADAPEDWIDFMIELADFEWSLYTLFDAPGAEGSGYASVDDLANPALRLQPALLLRQYRFPVNHYYQQVADEQDPDHPDPAPVCVALVRSHYRSGIFSLRPLQYELLQRIALLQPGQPFQLAVRHTLDQLGPAGHATVQQWLLAWVQAGFLVINQPYTTSCR